MYKLSTIIGFLLSTFMFSCNNFSDIKKEDICGKKYTSSYNDYVMKELNYEKITTLNCDGTFESKLLSSVNGNNTKVKNQYTGKWEIIQDIDDKIKKEVTDFGLENQKYSIIKYSSSNGVNDYCLYYINSSSNSPVFATLNISCHPDNAGIYDGYPEN